MTHERFIVITKNGDISGSYAVLADAQELDFATADSAGIIRIVVENSKIKHCHEVGSVDP